MFKKIRRKDRAISKQEAIEILTNGEYGILSTIGIDGYPYGIPVNYVYQNGNIYFHCAIKGHKLDNITYNNKVSFCVVGNTKVIPEKFGTNYESAILFGKAVKVSGDEKNEALISLLEKYSSEFMEKGMLYIQKLYDKTVVVKISIEHVSGKSKK